MPLFWNYLTKCPYFLNSILTKSSFVYIFKWNLTLLELNNSNVKFHLNFQKNISGKICIELDIANVEFHL